MLSRAEKLWAKDIDQIERPYLGGMSITNLPPRMPDGRTPSQGSVSKRCVNIDEVVGIPNWLTVALVNCKWATTRKPL